MVTLLLPNIFDSMAVELGVHMANQPGESHEKVFVLETDAHLHLCELS